MAYYFQKMDTTLSPEQRETEGIILYNLDEFHTIIQIGKEVRATRGGEKSTLIAHCKTVEAAQYVIKNILEKRTLTIDEVIAIEEGASYV